MKSMILTGIVAILLVMMLIVGGCSTNQPQVNTEQKKTKEGSEIDQLLGVPQQGETKEPTADENEVLQLLGIAKEKKEEPTPLEPSKNEDQLKKEINDLEQKITNKDSEISKLKSDIAAKDDRINKLESNMIRQPAVSTTKYTATGNFREDYQNALSEYNNRNYKLAIQLFQELLARDATNSLSDNCQYWIGEGYYSLGNFNQAIIEFTKVFSFNNSNKMDDAQLKLGLCYWRLGDRDRARQEFERLINDYPKSEYVEKAQRYLSKL